MPRPWTLLGSVSLALAAVLVGCAGGPSMQQADEADLASPVVATIAGEPLTLDELEAAYHGSTGTPEADSAGAMADFLERYVDFRLKVREARALGLDEDSTLQAEIRDYRNQLARPYLLERKVLEDIIRDLYEKQQQEVHAGHILLRVTEDAPPADTLAAYERALALRDSLEAGADFSALARRHSEDPSVYENEGDLGYFTGGRMIHAFEQMAYETPVGGVAPVFRTPFGYHVMQVFDRRARRPDIRASHILVRLGPEATAADSSAARDLLEELRERVLAGEDFAELAREYSDDEASGQRGGDLGFFGRSRMVPPFAEAAFALEEVGALSGVVETSFGYHLILLTDVQELPSFEEHYPELKRLAQRLPRTATRRRALGRAFREEVGSHVDRALVREAAALYPADSLLRRLSAERFGPYAAREFASIGDSTLTLGRFADFIGRGRIGPAPDQLEQVLTLTEYFLDEQAVDFAAYQLEERDEAFARIMADYADGVLLFRISEDSVWNVASRDSLGARAFFEAHRERYHYPERHRVLAFYSRSDSLLQVVAEGLDAGLRPAEAMAAVAEAEHAVRSETIRLSSPTEAFFDEALTLEVGQRTAPRPYRSEHAFLYLDGLEAPRPMTFEEARARVTTDYQDHLDAAFRARLREKYHVRLYPERLRLAEAAPTTALAQ